MQKVLIATTNPGKFGEIVSYFSDLSFKFVNLKDVGLDKVEAEEPFDTTWENALNKAKFYAKKSGLLTVAEDTAFYVNHLKGMPGIKAKRFALTPEARNEKILKLLKGIPTSKRDAYFETHACVYHPDTDVFAVFPGRVDGLISEKSICDFRKGMNYDCVFYYPPLKKNFSELTIAEKNIVSHRGLAISKVRFYFAKQFSFRQMIVPAAIIIKDKKLFFTKRRDIRKDFNNKWEFPGGGVDRGESIINCLKREVKEETGFDIEPVELLPEIMTRVENKFNYQVFLPIYICKITSGKINIADNETADYGWFTLQESLKLDFLPLNKEIIQQHKNILKKYLE
ncbi:MAG: non-canonical purine NTP pyrophosphatase [Candidatus Magasanikbacteria bacterium]